jgi:hypothetical protein
MVNSRKRTVSHDFCVGSDSSWRLLYDHVSDTDLVRYLCTIQYVSGELLVDQEGLNALIKYSPLILLITTVFDAAAGRCCRTRRQCERFRSSGHANANTAKTNPANATGPLAVTHAADAANDQNTPVAFRAPF